MGHKKSRSLVTIVGVVFIALLIGLFLHSIFYPTKLTPTTTVPRSTTGTKVNVQIPGLTDHSPGGNGSSGSGTSLSNGNNTGSPTDQEKQ